jgi:hypothetical protein
MVRDRQPFFEKSAVTVSVPASLATYIAFARITPCRDAMDTSDGG